METKGRRASRPAEPIGAPTGPVDPDEIGALPGRQAEAAPEPPMPAEILAEAAKSAETALNLIATAAEAKLQPKPASISQPTKPASTEDMARFGRDAFSALAQSQAALTRGFGALSAEMAGIALSGAEVAARTAAKIAGIKTLADAIEVNAGFACGSLDTLLGGSAKLSQLGVKLATETSEPILNQFGRSWSERTRHSS